MIIRTSEGDFVTTGHAEWKMLSESVSVEEIIETIEKGDFDYTESGNEIYRHVIKERTIAVVISPDSERIITVFVVR